MTRSATRMGPSVPRSPRKAPRPARPVLARALAGRPSTAPSGLLGPLAAIVLVLMPCVLGARARARLAPRLRWRAAEIAPHGARRRSRPGGVGAARGPHVG